MDKDSLIIIISVLTFAVVWLYIKLKTEKKQQETLSKQNAKLIADNALLEAEHLKFQLQPHTLNNILAHLKLTANKLNKGLASLSETLEYILYKGNSHLVSVDEEMKFIQEYLRLNELFISELDAIKEDYSQVNRNSKHFSSPCIPHLITAYFIENAFKHGSIKEKESLKITLKLSDKEFEMTVVNKMKQKLTTAKGGLGLSNMKKRLELLASNKYDIKNNINENEFYSTLTITF
jgi:two-component system LytT family sensor kinase